MKAEQIVGRICKECCGLIFKGERTCACAGRTFKCPGVSAPEGSLEASHYWQLFKTMRTGSWAKTGYRAPHSPERTLRRMLYQDGLRIGLRVRSFGQWNTTDLEYFIFRCEVARTYWRDHFAGLMGSRVELLISGCKRQKVCDYLGISRESLKWLDTRGWPPCSRLRRPRSAHA